jgi:hypothetical protein
MAAMCAYYCGDKSDPTLVYAALIDSCCGKGNLHAGGGEVGKFVTLAGITLTRL